MKCYACPKTHEDGPLFRQNEKGEDAIWGCAEHNSRPTDPQVAEITTLVHESNRRPGIEHILKRLRREYPRAPQDQIESMARSEYTGTGNPDTFPMNGKLPSGGMLIIKPKTENKK